MMHADPLMDQGASRTGTMDVMQKNLDFMQATRLHNMTVEELVQAEHCVDSKFHFADGIWWREVKPFFYHPAAVCTTIVPGKVAPKRWRALGGYYHRVPSEAESNGQVVVNEIAEPSTFKLSQLRKKVRYEVRRALSVFEVRRVTLSAQFLEEGFRIYCEWEKRIGDVRVRRSEPVIFQTWATRVLQHPFNLVLGAYREEKLAAYIIANAVDGVADLSKSFTDPKFYPLSPSSCLNYAYVTICGQSTGIRIACSGLRSMNQQLQHYKEKLGYKCVSYPAFICLRPILKPLVRHFLPRQYGRLMGEYPKQTISPGAV